MSKLQEQKRRHYLKYRERYLKKAATLRETTSPETKRNWQLNTKFGITLEQYNALVRTQNGVCSICKSIDKAIYSKTGKLRELAVDHCHITGKIRGLLCTNCNTGLGKFKDSTSLFMAALGYLNG